MMECRNQHHANQLCRNKFRNRIESVGNKIHKNLNGFINRAKNKFKDNKKYTTKYWNRTSNKIIGNFFLEAP